MRRSGIRFRFPCLALLGLFAAVAPAPATAREVPALVKVEVVTPAAGAGARVRGTVRIDFQEVRAPFCAVIRTTLHVGHDVMARLEVDDASTGEVEVAADGVVTLDLARDLPVRPRTPGPHSLVVLVLAGTPPRVLGRGAQAIVEMTVTEPGAETAAGPLSVEIGPVAPAQVGEPIRCATVVRLRDTPGSAALTVGIEATLVRPGCEISRAWLLEGLEPGSETRVPLSAHLPLVPVSPGPATLRVRVCALGAEGVLRHETSAPVIVDGASGLTYVEPSGNLIAVSPNPVRAGAKLAVALSYRVFNNTGNEREIRLPEKVAIVAGPDRGKVLDGQRVPMRLGARAGQPRQHTVETNVGAAGLLIVEARIGNDDDAHQAIASRLVAVLPADSAERPGRPRGTFEILEEQVPDRIVEMPPNGSSPILNFEVKYRVKTSARRADWFECVRVTGPDGEVTRGDRGHCRLDPDEGKYIAGRDRMLRGMELVNPKSPGRYVFTIGLEGEDFEPWTLTFEVTCR